MFYQNQLHSNESRWTDIALYAAFAFCVVVIFGYVVFLFKAGIEQKKIATLENRIAALGAMPNQKAAEQTVVAYQKKLQDYRAIAANHKITSRVFTFIEGHTLPTVWFSSFDMSQPTTELSITGETDSLATLGRQTKLFEDDTQYVQAVSIINSQTQSSGKVLFTMAITFTPAIFK